VKIGRPLQSGEQVHHVNENTFDNLPDNLEVLTPKEHRQRHAMYPERKECAVCSVEFTPHPSKRKRQQTCSRKCSHELARRNVPRKISVHDRDSIRKRRSSGEKLTEIARDFGVSATTISDIARGVGYYA
jgi:hypothetical protein